MSAARQPEDVHTLSGPYVCDALDDLERAVFVRHLSYCGSCATETAELLEVAGLLGGCAVRTPPRSLEAAVLRRIRGTRQLPSRCAPSAGGE